LVVVGLGAVALVAHLAAQDRAPMRQVGYLKASNPGSYSHFGEGGVLPAHTGSSVAISRDGNTIAVGASHESSGARGINATPDEAAYAAGAVYVFTRNGAGWSPQAYVKASNADASDQFGSSVVLSADGNTMAVAAHREASSATGVNGNQTDNSIQGAGAVYIFTRSGDTWSQQAYLKASNTGEPADDVRLASGDQFGFSLAMSADGDTLAVGAISEDSNASGIDGDQADNSASSAGAVYVFTRSANTWSQQAYIKSSSAPEDTDGDLFGFSLGLTADGNTLAVGVYDESGSSRGINGPIDGERRGSGAAYVFTRNGSAWSRQAYLKVSNAENGDSWGVSLALSDDGSTLALGSVDEDCEATGINPPGCGDEGLGSSGGSMGAAAVFVRDGTTWTQQAYLKASNTGIEDWFGLKMALSAEGDTLAITAALEDSAAQGINGRQDDDSAVDAGAVYLFRRTGATWAQESYVKSTHNEAFDEFGNTVALSADGRTMVVGARGEDSGATGVDGDQTDNSVDESGAAYVFSR
jgi:hypothetical protein